ncbi:hypothetical protein C4K04_3785 [Pseudomonas chlororaphis]|uniref:Uncharacterized protein n=1 Tax=Pseudomonas chlororaphis TaxID=587753 RepID=A0A3G7TQR5_9PSED|nr:hypothetical protein C4K04_3785 [Pseudomonas chlororaphis]
MALIEEEAPSRYRHPFCASNWACPAFMLDSRQDTEYSEKS